MVPPRYSARPFPSYRFVPGKNPHPTRDRRGHSFDLRQEHLAAFDPDFWYSCEVYLHAIDLFNHGFWWEAHEALEVVWVAAGRRTPTGSFIQGLIQVSVAYLKAAQGFRATAGRMADKGLQKLGSHRGCYLGIDVVGFRAAVKAGFAADPVTPVTVELHGLAAR